MTILTLLMHLKSHSSSIRTPVKILHKVLHILTTIVVTGVELAEYINTLSWNRPAFYNYDDDDDEDYTIAITPEEPVDSLIMKDEHLDTIPATKSDEDLSNSNDDSTSIDEDYFSIDNIDYVEASPPNSELISLEEVKDDILREILLNVHLLIDKIESLNDNPTLDRYDSFLFEIDPDQGELTSIAMKDNLGEPRVHVPNVLPTHPTLMLDSDFIPSDNYLPESEIFCFDIEEKNSGSTTIYADISLPDFDHFHIKIEPDPGELTSIVDFGIRENVLSATNVKSSPEDE
nr:hypothetical protein [Tanacetum cinerariifolium]